MTLDFYQILYKEEQRKELYPFAKPYFSIGITPYFENAIIAGLVPMSQADYISVCSWRLRKKRNDGYATVLLGFEEGTNETKTLTEERILNAPPFDVAILTPHSPAHKPLGMAPNWHGSAWVNAFDAFKPFLSRFGKVPDELKYSIYENHFIARKEIYHEYVSTCLLPAVEFIGRDPVYYVDSSYIQKKRDQEEIKRVQSLLGAKDWPIMPFLLERLFGIFINSKSLKVINL